MRTSEKKASWWCCFCFEEKQFFRQWGKVEEDVEGVRKRCPLKKFPHFFFPLSFSPLLVERSLFQGACWFFYI